MTAVPNRKALGWLYAVLPALILLFFRLAVRTLPPAAEISLMCVAFILAVLWYRRKKKTPVFHLSVLQVLLCIGAGAACGTLSWLCFGKPADYSAGIPAFLLLCVLGPATEEIVYRGLVYEQFLRFLPESGAILLNSLLFGVAHGSPVQMVIACIAGILFSLARKKTGTVLASVLMHIVMNVMVFFL